MKPARRPAQRQRVAATALLNARGAPPPARTYVCVLQAVHKAAHEVGAGRAAPVVVPQRARCDQGSQNKLAAAQLAQPKLPVRKSRMRLFVCVCVGGDAAESAVPGTNAHAHTHTIQQAPQRGPSPRHPRPLAPAAHVEHEKGLPRAHVAWRLRRDGLQLRERRAAVAAGRQERGVLGAHGLA